MMGNFLEDWPENWQNMAKKFWPSIFRQKTKQKENVREYVRKERRSERA
jgi:hypothetical protein